MMILNIEGTYFVSSIFLAGSEYSCSGSVSRLTVRHTKIHCGATALLSKTNVPCDPAVSFFTKFPGTGDLQTVSIMLEYIRNIDLGYFS